MNRNGTHQTSREWERLRANQEEPIERHAPGHGYLPFLLPYPYHAPQTVRNSLLEFLATPDAGAAPPFLKHGVNFYRQ